MDRGRASSSCGIVKWKEGFPRWAKWSEKAVVTLMLASLQLKVLKQRIRDHVKPEQDLGHSDAHEKEKRGTEAGQ